MNLPPLPFEPKTLVPRVAQPSHEEVWSRMYDEPVIYTGCLESWSLHRELRARPAYEDKLALMRQLIGEQPVSYLRLPRDSNGTFHYPPDLSGDPVPPERITNASFSSFAEQLLPILRGESGDYVYMQSHGFERGSPLHQSIDANVLPWMSEKHFWPRLWMGSNGNVTQLHYDEFGNFICMADGYKRVTMFAPDQLPNMYHMPFDRMIEYAQASGVKLLDLNLEKFPRFRTALRNAYVAVLAPGDILSIPPMWWHHVESFGLNVMVNNWIHVIHITKLNELLKNVTQGVRMFHARSAAERDAARSLFRQKAFGVPRTTEPDGHPGGVDTAALNLLEETRVLLEPLHSLWRRWHAELYDQFVFQVNGHPFPALGPDELGNLLKRQAASEYLYPNAAAGF
jgi:hypothetical protein